MRIKIFYEDSKNGNRNKTVIEFKESSFTDGDIEHFKTLCCDLCMPYGFIGNWFYGEVFSEFLENINSKDKYIIVLDTNNKILYGKYTGRLKEI